MYLNHLTIRDLAGLGSADLAFERGLNVVVGDNEAGKSTLLVALRAAFFTRHRASGESVRALAPYGRQVRPEVEVDFHLGATRYRLSKSFLQKPEAILEWDGGTLQGDAVEERLAELLGFAHGARGSKLDENQGAFGLLWVEQGRAPGGLDLGVGRDAVAQALEGEVGQILGGERGRHLLAASKALQDRFFTATLRARSDSPLKQVEDALAAARETLGEKRAVRRGFEERMERLLDRRERLRAYERQDARAGAERALQAARTAAGALDVIQRQFAEAERDVAQALERREAALDRHGRRRALKETLAAAAAAQEAARTRLADLRAQAEATVAERDQRQDALIAAREGEHAAERALEASARETERQRIAAELTRANRDLAEAEQLDARRRALAGSTGASAISAEGLARLETAVRELREAEIRHAAAVPALRFEPDASQRVREGERGWLDTGQELRVDGERVFDLEGFGRLIVRAGDGVAGSGEVLSRCMTKRDDLLRSLGIGSLEAARRAHAAGDEAARERRLVDEALRRAAPQGIASLREMSETLERQLGSFSENDGRDGVEDIETLRATRMRARAAREARETELEQVAAGLSERQRLMARAEAEAEHHEARHAALAAELASSEQARAESALAQDVAAAELDLRARAAVLELRRTELASADPEAARLELARAGEAVAQLERTIGELVRETSSLEGELRVQGATAIGEDIERLEGEVGALEEQQARLSLEARASRLLHETLETAQRTAREHWLGPIQSRLQPYLRLVQPEARVEFDETSLEIRGLQRQGQEEDFRRLSHGAREQLAVITRLALAEVLKRGGHPAAVILDDALVNTDEKRLARMHLVLRRAAEALQVIVLTCREGDFVGLGAPIMRL